jgi:hypothetical protein
MGKLHSIKRAIRRNPDIFRGASGVEHHDGHVPKWAQKFGPGTRIYALYPGRRPGWIPCGLFSYRYRNAVRYVLRGLMAQ